MKHEMSFFFKFGEMTFCGTVNNFLKKRLKYMWWLNSRI